MPDLVLLFEMIKEFFLLGLFSYGGGYVIVAMLHDSLVTRGWISQEMLTNIIAVAEMTPGPISINTATYVGKVMHGFVGALATTISVCVPSYILVIIATKYFQKYREHAILKKFFYGIRPAVVALLIGAAYIMVKGIIPEQISTNYLLLVKMIIIAIIMAILTFQKKFKFHPIALIIFSGFLGAILL